MDERENFVLLDIQSFHPKGKTSYSGHLNWTSSGHRRNLGFKRPYAKGWGGWGTENKK
jgi:hypothetical protein